jgi:penicillin amidase
MARTSLWVKYPFWCRFVALVVLPILALAIVAVIGLWKSLPHTGGQLNVTGLRAPVSVARDEKSIPDIRASNDHDAYFALGFVHAQDRLWQMEMTRRTGAGRLSEVLGEPSLSSDITMRRLGLYDNAKKILQGLDQSSRAVLQAYVNGVNAGATALSVLPVQFHLVGMRPEPWRAEDSLVMMQMMAWQLSSNLGAEIQRLLLIQNYGIATANTLMPGGPSELAAAVAGVGAGEVKKYTGIGYESSIFGDPRKTIGSNGWAVSGKHTASGLPILANDPHLSTPIPSLWYLANIKGDTLDVAGATMPGLPFVLIGCNPDIAWGMTNAMADTQDVVIEDINPMNHDQYKVGDAYVDMLLKREEIHVKQDFLRAPREPEVITVRRTRHGPMVSDISDPLGRISFSVRWTGDDDHGGTFASFVKMNYARNWTQFNDALSTFVAPIHNFVYADRSGNIGYVAPGKYPLRASGNGSVPVLGSRAGDTWTGTLAYTDVPRSFNPPEGFVVTANNNFLSRDYQHHLTSDWAPGYRAERIRAELDRLVKTGTGKLTAQDMARLQSDVVTPSMQNGILAAMRKVSAQTPAQARALAVLRAWNGAMSEDSSAATLYTSWLSHLNILLLEKIKEKAVRSAAGVDPLGRMKYRDNDEFVEKVLSGSQDQLCSTATPAGPAACGEVLRLALDRALVELATALGSDEHDWQWGKVHRIKYAHFPFSKARYSPSMPAVEESAFSTIFDRTAASAGGSNTVNVGTPSLEKETKYLQFEGAMYRQIVDFGDPSASLFIQGTGQSGNPFSRHYDDLIDLHQQGRYVPMIKRAAVTTMRLQPLTNQ